MAAAVAPSILPVVMDVCGNALEAPVPEEEYVVLIAEVARTYTYTYVDCSGLEFEWVYTYTIYSYGAPAQVGTSVDRQSG